MGQQALTIAGQVIGNIIYPGIGGAIGGAIGAVAGAALFPPDDIHNEGPRLTGINIQQSSPGACKPIIYGAMRVAGQVTWAQYPFTEVVNTEEEGGKGGGPEVTTTTYSYFGDFAVSVCDNEIQNLRRIWADGVCFYDITDPLNTEALIASANYAQYFKLYLGTETELPDPTEESWLGVGNVPAYRGTARIVFTQLPLALHGNRIPNLEFEIVEQADTALGQLLVDRDDLTPHYRDNLSIGTYPQAVVTEFSSVIRVGNIGVFADGIIRVYDLEGNYLQDDEPTEREVDILSAVLPNGSTPYYCMRFASDALTLWIENPAFAQDHPTTPSLLYTAAEQDDGPIGGTIFDLIPSTKAFSSITPCVDETHFIVWSCTPPGDADEWHLIRYAPGSFTLVREGTLDASVSISNHDLGFNTFTTYSTGQSGASVLESDLRHIWANHYGDGGLRVYEIDSEDEVFELLAFSEPATIPYPGIWPTTGLLVYVAGVLGSTTESGLRIYSRLPYETGAGRILGDICKAICIRAGFDEDELDTADLTELVLGYALAAPMNARAALEQLASIYQFAAVESNGVLKFRYRNGPSLATIPYEDLGAVTEGQQKQAVIESDRRQETELPVRVNLRYVAVDANYQVGAQSQARTTTGSRDPQLIEAAIALTDTRARQAADSVLYEQWVGRVTRKFCALRAWSTIEPTDIVTVEDRNAEYTLRIIAKRELGAVLEFEGVDQSAAVYESNVVGAPILSIPTLTTEAITRLVLMDIPQLRDVDDNAGMYATVYKYGSGSWKGAVIQRADNPAGPFLEIASTTREGTVGRASTALGNWIGGNVVDVGNTVDVQIFSTGTLSSVTRSELYGSANYALLGDELIQFETAVLLSGTTYRLSNFLRQRKGTVATGHAAGDRFVLLETSKLFRIPVALDHVGATRYYRATTFGATPSSTYDQAITHAGNAIKPLSAGNIVAVREYDTDDVYIRWHRRARIATAWRDLVDVPLDETTEAYEVDFYEETNTTFLSTIAASTPEVTYTSAQQITDLGSDSAAFWARIYQISDRVGRGFVGEIVFGTLSDSLITEGGDPFITEGGDFFVTE